MANYSWLFFDADGTLFDYDLAEAGALEGTFGDLGMLFKPEWAEQYRVINAQVWLDFEQGRVTASALRVLRFQRLFEQAQVTTDVEMFSARYLVNLGQQGQLVEGAEAVLRKLSGRFRMALITNGLKDVQRSRLARSPIDGYFTEVAISEEIGAAKPDPAYFDAVFDHIGRPPKDQVLVIGDSLSSDIQGGMRYGLDTCWYNPAAKLAQPDLLPTYEIRRLDELLGLLGEA